MVGGGEKQENPKEESQRVIDVRSQNSVNKTFQILQNGTSLYMNKEDKHIPYLTDLSINKMHSSR